MIPAVTVQQILAAPSLRRILMPTRVCANHENRGSDATRPFLESIKIHRPQHPNGAVLSCRADSHKVRLDDGTVHHFPAPQQQYWTNEMTWKE